MTLVIFLLMKIETCKVSSGRRSPNWLSCCRVFKIRRVSIGSRHAGHPIGRPSATKLLSSSSRAEQVRDAAGLAKLRNSLLRNWQVPEHECCLKICPRSGESNKRIFVHRQADHSTSLNPPSAELTGLQDGIFLRQRYLEAQPCLGMAITVGLLSNRDPADRFARRLTLR